MSEKLDDQPITKISTFGKLARVFGFLAFLGLIILAPAGMYVNEMLGHAENALMYIIQFMGILLIPFSFMLILVILKRKMNKLLLLFPLLLIIGPSVFFIYLAKSRLFMKDLVSRSGTIVPEVEVKDFYEFWGEDKSKLDFDPTEIKKTNGFDCRTKWPGCITIIHNQGNCGTCWSYATTSVLGDLNNIKKHKEMKLDKKSLPEEYKIDVSPQFLVDCWKGYEGEGKCDSGETVRRAMNYGKTIGAVELEKKPLIMSSWSKDTNKCNGLSCFKKCKVTDKDTVYKFKNVRILSKKDSLANNILRIKHSLMNNGPVVAGMVIYDNIPNGLYSGIYFGKTPGAKNLGGHAIYIIGWGNNNVVGDYWIIKNSWGKVWGVITDPGYLYIKTGMCGVENYAWEGKV
jgi:hypothetical protein